MVDQLFIPSSIIECAWEFVQHVFCGLAEGIQIHPLEYPVGCALGLWGFWPVAKSLEFALLVKSWTVGFHQALPSVTNSVKILMDFLEFVKGAKWQKASSLVASESCLCFLWSMSYCWLYLLCSGTMDFRKAPKEWMYYYHYTVASCSHCSWEWNVNWREWELVLPSTRDQGSQSEMVPTLGQRWVAAPVM